MIDLYLICTNFDNNEIICKIIKETLTLKLTITIELLDSPDKHFLFKDGQNIIRHRMADDVIFANLSILSDLFLFGSPASGSERSPGRFLDRKMSKVNQIFFLATRPHFRAADEIFPSTVLVVSSSEKISRFSRCACSSLHKVGLLSRKCSMRKECCGQWKTGHVGDKMLLLRSLPLPIASIWS